jgi:hypothetical protein
MIAVPRVGSSVAGDLGDRGRAGVGGGVEVDHAVVRAAGAGAGEDRALLGGHARQVRLDIGEAIAVGAGEAPAARRQPARDLDDLADLAALDAIAQQRVDHVVPRQQEAVEVGLAGRPQEPVGRRERAVQELAGRRGERGVRQPVRQPGEPGVVGGRADASAVVGALDEIVDQPIAHRENRDHKGAYACSYGWLANATGLGAGPVLSLNIRPVR